MSISVAIPVVFPTGSQAAGWTLWGLDYDQWRRIQMGSLGAFAVGVLVHLILHWTWVCNFVGARWPWRRGPFKSPNESMKTVYGVILLVVFLTLLAAFVAVAQFAVRAPRP